MHSKRPLCPGVLPGGVLREEGRVVLGALILVRRGGLAVGLSVRVPRPAAKTRLSFVEGPPLVGISQKEMVFILLVQATSFSRWRPPACRDFV